MDEMKIDTTEKLHILMFGLAAGAAFKLNSPKSHKGYLYFKDGRGLGFTVSSAGYLEPNSDEKHKEELDWLVLGCLKDAKNKARNLFYQLNIP